jgi:hypothetical protein
MNVFLGLFGTLSGILFATAVGVMSMSPPQYDIARGAALGAACSAVITYVLWLLSTDEPLLVKATIGVITGIVSLGALPLGLNWINDIEYNNNSIAKAAVVPKNVGKLEAEAKILFSTKNRENAITIIEIGDSGTKFFWGGKEGSPMFNFYGSDIIVEAIGNSTKITTQIKDDNGDLVAEIIRNEWKVAPPPKTWDRNYSNDVLEVINPKGKVVLQVRVLPDRIQLQGEWRGDANHGIRLVKSDDIRQAGGVFVVFGPMLPNGPPNSPEIKRIFAYPSEFHFGELSK